MSNGAELIAAERERQVAEEGYTAEHDTGHATELIEAAQAYTHEVLYPDNYGFSDDGRERPCPEEWPWALRYWKPSGDKVRDLVKAGALIAAAIDSLTVGPGVCTCPSGDGSLRWPCPVHPPTNRENGSES